MALNWIHCLWLATLLPRLASAALTGPYMPDAHTLVLLHLDEVVGSTVTTNIGLMGGNFITVNYSSDVNANSGVPVVTSMLGFPGYSTNPPYAFFPTPISFDNCESNTTAGYLLGYDFNRDGFFEGDQGNGTSLDFLAMTNLNIGNGGQSPFTLEALICPTSTNGNQEIICTDSDALNRAFQFRISSGTLMFQFINPPLQALSGNIPTLAQDPENGFVASTWYHVAFTYDGTNGTIYWTKLDPSLVAAHVLAIGPLTMGSADGTVMGPLCIGNRGRPTGTETFLGAIDEVRISSVARAASQMLFSSGSGPASPTIITPANPVYAGTQVTLSSPLSGTTSTDYFWQGDGGSGGSIWTSLPDSTTNTYVIDTTGMTVGNYEYRLVATNASGAYTNTPGTLNLVPAIIQSISLSPTNNPVYAGTPVNLSASTSGLSLAYRWQTDNGSSGAVWGNLSGSTTNTDAVDTTGMAAGNYQYRLVVTNTYGSVTSSVVTLNLANASGPVLVSDTIISPSAAYAGNSVLMSAAFAGNAPITCQWFFTARGSVTTTPIPGATNTTYSIANVQTNAAGSYFLMASNNPPGLGSRTLSSTPAVLSVSTGGMFCDLLEHPEETVITALTPEFGWVYNPTCRSDSQTAYRIIVASSEALANAGTGDMWDSGMVTNSSSINVVYAGVALQPGASYFWCVQTVNSLGQLGAFSGIQKFNTAAQLSDPLTTPGVVYQQPSAGSANCYPMQFVAVSPLLVTTNSLGHWFIDFGNDAFGFATVHVNGNYNGINVSFGLGELASDNIVNTSPGDTIRYWSGSFTLQNGNLIYTNRSSTPVGTISPPAATYGIVSPFRYLELSGLPAGVTLTTNDVTQQRLQTQFDDNAATFDSSSAALNQVWSLCKYSMKALTFDGIYVDGDRERTPYEADSYMHMLSSYAVNNDFTMPRCTFEYLTSHLTWPTEWPMHMVFVAWADYQQTGDPYLMTKYYGFLTNKCMLSANAGANGLVQSYPESGNTASGDIIDWYRIGSDGIGNTDGYVPGATNAVINAFYYRCLTIMAQAAQLTGHSADSANFASRASLVFSNYNKIFWNAGSQSYIDSEGTPHSSAHANFFPLAFGLVPTNNQAAVVSFLNSRVAANNGMPPGVYGAQYMLEGMFLAGDADVALGLMTTNGPRSWLNMISLGSTITDEAWSTANKANEDWNHAWGAAAGNLIPRYVLGLRPLTAGYGQVLIQPQLGRTLSYLQGTIPTIRGPVSISATNAPGQFQLLLNIPGNVTATVLLPTLGAANPTALMDGNLVSGTVSNGWLTVTNIGSGQHAVWLYTNSALSQTALYNNWAASWFGTNASNASIAGMNADPDGAGVPNLLEYAVGGNPLVAGATNATVQGWLFSPSQFSLRYLLRNPPNSVTAQFQSSGDLLNWSNTSPAAVNVLQNFGANSVYQALFPVQFSPQFFRLWYGVTN
jgi:hypothetical protein